jgi:hypothetical protein
MDISARAFSLADRPRLDHLGHQCLQAPGRPNLHLVSSSRRPRLETANRVASSLAPHIAQFLCSSQEPFLRPGPHTLLVVRRTIPAYDTFSQTLRELGWIENRNLVFEYRCAEGRADQLPRLASELVQLKVDLIFSAWGTPAALAAKAASATIPVVFAGVGNAIGVGLVANLARPGETLQDRRSSLR